MRPLRDFLVYICVESAVLFFRLLPLKAAVSVGKAFGSFSYLFAGRTREKALSNLRLVFGAQKTEQEYRVICKTLFRNLGRNFAEILKLDHFVSHGFDGFIEIDGQDILDQVRDKEGGMVLLTPHFGNWELLPHYLRVKQKIRLCIVARHLRNNWVHKSVHKMRTSTGVNVVYRMEGVRSLIRALRDKQVLGLLPDVVVAGVNSLKADFMGHPSLIPTGPVELALLTGAPIVPSFVIRKENGYLLKIEPPIYPDKSIDKGKAIEKYTLQWSSIMEKYIKKYPDHWIWIHEKWNVSQ